MQCLWEMCVREWDWLGAPPAVNSAGGAMGDACGVHLSAPTHARLKIKPISVIMQQQDRCLVPPVLPDLGMHMLGSVVAAAVAVSFTQDALRAEFNLKNGV